MKFYFYILVIIFLVSNNALGQKNIKVFNKKDGLISNCIDFIGQDRNGDMWFVAGEPGAPTKWDSKDYFGREIESYRQAKGLVGTTMQLAEKLSTIYGVSRFDGENWYTYKTKKDGLVDKKIQNVFIDSRGWIYFSTLSGISIWDGRKMSIVNQKNGLAGNYVNDIFEDSKNNIWVATEDGLSMFNGNTWKSWNKKNGLGSNVARKIYEDKYGNIWVTIGDGFSYKGLSMWDGSKWNIINKTNGLKQNDVNAFLVDKKGNLWVSYTVSFKGYISRYNGTWKHYTSKNNGSFDASLIYEDNDGSIVIFANGKYARLEGDKWIKIDESETKKTGYYDSRGNIWQLTISGVKYYNNKSKKWIEINKTNGLPDKYIRSIYEDKQGNIWLGSQKKGVFKLKYPFEIIK